MAEWTAVAVQTVNPGESIVFTENPAGSEYEREQLLKFIHMIREAV